MENLKHLRKEAHLTQVEFAKKFNLSLRGYQDIENGINETNYKNLIRFADFFGCSIDYLLGHRVSETPLQLKLISSIKSLDEDLCKLAEAYIEGLKATQRQRDMIRERVKQSGVNENID